jgi:hypothetical protein
VPGFPNLFLPCRPNTNLGSGFVVRVLEARIGYVRQALDVLGSGVGRDERRLHRAERALDLP